MSFLNKYNKSDNNYYLNSLCVNDAIYAIGCLVEADETHTSLITKLDLDGNVIWEKRYHFNGKEIEFSKIVECSNFDILLLGVDSQDSNRVILSRINPNGDVIWTKALNHKFSLSNELSVTNLVKVGNENYFIALQIEDPLVPDIVIFKFDKDGDILVQKRIHLNQGVFNLRGITANEKKIGLYGGLSQIEIEKSGFVLELDLQLNQVIKKYEENTSNEVLDLIYDDDFAYVRTSSYSTNFFVKLELESTAIINLITKHYNDYLDNLKFNNDNLFLESYGRDKTIISKLDYNFNVLWTKRYEHYELHAMNGILCDVTQDRTILIDGGRGGVGFENSPIGNLDLDMNSCRTYDEELISIVLKSCYFAYSSRNLDLLTSTIDFLNITLPIVKNVVSVKEAVCSFENTCEQDLVICELYQSILDVNTKCLINPQDADENTSFIDFLKCFNQISSLIYDFHKLYPHYQLYTIHFVNQLGTFQIFKNDPSFQNYLISWEAVQYILNYLTVLGNCNCENTLQIKDNSSIQSGHLYLQSVGSKGVDSTKGIHLRWALKGALSRHLPKANYATTNFNFNKQDDFVKIYRAKYNEKKIIIDFTTAPSLIEESPFSKVWIYTIEGKVFYVNFKNLIKYNQVRSTINPATDSLLFIKSYGNSLIEVENKTELSFAISPFFQITNSTNSVRLELLSVEENKISAPKGASLRKRYSINEVNETKLISENIRTIRFISENSFIERLEFEFYSDFILDTQKNNGWNFLGNFALTKETNVAYSRLEPVQNCLTKWLRYNDDAYVNVDNYKDKWGGPLMGEESRIKSVVEKYIDLSNDFDNPDAIEIVSLYNSDDIQACMLENEDFDPLITDNEDENENANGFELSNLHLLQMGGLDYHIARMLGLGTLDLNASIFDGEYLYLAEYVTFGNLNDGLGARELQHLYCSLPTKLTDQRLPIAIDLKEPVDGIFYNYNAEEIEQEYDSEQDTNLQLTVDGYSHDGKTKFYTLLHEESPEEILNANFYYRDDEFVSSEVTVPVFAGLEYRKSTSEQWDKPELSYSREYFNIDNTVDQNFANETREIIIPEPGKALYIHKVKVSGTHIYSSYGINWFSRAKSSDVIRPVTTVLKQSNELLPPTNITSTLIQKENPLVLTSSLEQTMFAVNENQNEDKTLVRLTFEYNHQQELIDYHHKINGEIIKDYVETHDSKELFAEEIQIFFRNHLPKTVSGKVVQPVDHPTNPLLCIFNTDVYGFVSGGLDFNGDYNESVEPILPLGSEQNFVGSLLLADGKEFVVHLVEISPLTGYPIFTVFKRDATDALTENSSNVNLSELQDPENNSLFVVVENMLNLDSWANTIEPLFSLPIVHTEIHREEEIIISDATCNERTHVHKFRGIYENASIEKVYERVDDDNDGLYDVDSEGEFIERHLGLYKVTFNVPMPQYPHINNTANTVEFYNGVVRIHTIDDPSGPRKNFRVVRTENIGTNENLVLYISDLTFPTDPDYLATYKGKLVPDDQELVSQVINYYPGYKVYLYENQEKGFDELNTLPVDGEDYRYTIFGLRSTDHPFEHEYDNLENQHSSLSVPSIMFAQAIVEPKTPQKPMGGWYATRPDFFGKSTYTFKTKYDHKPHSVQFNRASDVQFLSAIYNNEVIYDDNHQAVQNTVQYVLEELFLNGEEPYYVDRWKNLLSFDYDYEDLPSDFGLFKLYDDVRLPMPDSPSFIASINEFIAAHNQFYNNLPSPVALLTTPIVNLYTEVIPEVTLPSGDKRNGRLTIRDFLKDILLNCFIPLTEVPVIYNYIKPSDYKPIPKKQVVRDRNGDLLKPDDPRFDMAPMAKRLDANGNFETQFTDFGLDGASNARYFYAVREISNQMKTSDYSEVLGPITLVNTAPPIAPEIIKIIPVLENRVLGIKPSIQLQINSYPTAHTIREVNIYRTFEANNALSIRTMDLIKTINLEAESMLEDSKWIFADDFLDLEEVPFGEPLFYKLSVSRLIKYTNVEDELVIDYAPSEASKLIITNIVENYSPLSPKLDYYSEPLNSNNELTTVVLHWQKTCFKAKYHLYKMNSQGNWVKIHELQTNDADIYLPLAQVNSETGTLSTRDLNGNIIYNHFKVITENTAGMLSREEYILTIHNESNWQDLGGIGEMIIEGTFYIR